MTDHRPTRVPYVDGFTNVEPLVLPGCLHAHDDLVFAGLKLSTGNDLDFRPQFERVFRNPSRNGIRGGIAIAFYDRNGGIRFTADDVEALEALEYLEFLTTNPPIHFAVAAATHNNRSVRFGSVDKNRFESARHRK